MEPFSSNHALQLLWIHYKEEAKYQLKLTKEEVKHLQLCLIDDWDELTTHYKKQLVTLDKLELLSLMSNGQPIFK
jgi:hypothetical protein